MLFFSEYVRYQLEDTPAGFSHPWPYLTEHRDINNDFISRLSVENGESGIQRTEEKGSDRAVCAVKGDFSLSDLRGFSCSTFLF